MNEKKGGEKEKRRRPREGGLGETEGQRWRRRKAVSHHGDPAEARHALADGRQVVEERRAAVRLAEVLHLLDQVGQRLQEVPQVGLERREETKFHSGWRTTSASTHQKFFAFWRIKH